MKEDSEFNTHFQEGLKRFKSGKFAESLAEFFNAAQIDPSSSDLHYYIGEALERHKQQMLTGLQPDGAASRVTRTSKRITQPVEPTPSQPVKSGKRGARRYKARIPIIVVAYDSTGKFFAELAMTRVTSLEGACIEMQRHVKTGAQLMLFSIDSRNAVPALVCDVQPDDSRARYSVGVEFLKGPVDWLVPS